MILHDGVSNVFERNIGNAYQHSLNFVTFRGEMMFPVHQHSGIRQHKCHVHHCILDTNTSVRTRPEYEVVLRICVG